MSSSKYDGTTIGSIEKRIEDGKEFEASSKLSVANSGASVKWLFRTGDKSVIINTRQITTNGDELTYQAFLNPTVTADGTPVTPIVNRNGESKISSTVKIFSAPTTTDNGAPIPPVYMPGSAALGGRTTAQFSQDGFVRILRTNSDYLVTIINNGNLNPAAVEMYLMWSEVNNPAPFQN